jgi:CheY-like chemotaxis protein
VIAMHRSAPSRPFAPSATTTRTPTVCVVDFEADGYPNWREEADAAGVRLTFVANAEEALRHERAERVDLWVVRAELPGLSGYDLCGMLKSRSKASPVFLVAQEYSAPAEQRAWAARATLFGAKGSHATWLAYWLRSRSSRPIANVSSAQPAEIAR